MLSPVPELPAFEASQDKVSTGGRSHHLHHRVAPGIGRGALRAGGPAGLRLFVARANRIKQPAGCLAAITLQQSTETALLVPSQDRHTGNTARTDRHRQQ